MSAISHDSWFGRVFVLATLFGACSPGGTVWERMCAAVPAGATPEATEAALARVPVTAAEIPDYAESIATLEVAGCRKWAMLEHLAQLNGNPKWECPTLKANLECDAKSDLTWICEQARGFVKAAPELTEQDHRNFNMDASTGRRARPPGTIPDKSTKLYGTDLGPREHEYHPDFDPGPMKTCEVVGAAKARAKAIGMADWSCPELATALGCKDG